MSGVVLYDAEVRHRRVAPAHVVRQRLRYAYLDIDDLPPTAAERRGVRIVGAGRFRRTDYFDGTTRPLAPAVLDLVEDRLGRRPLGPVRMLTQLRTMGWLFNPITVYYCCAADGTTLDAAVLEVSNTPWHERHWYVLDAADVAGRGEPFAKSFHVSPFMPMELTYRCRAPLPGERLALRIELSRATADGADEKVFDADLTGVRARAPRTGWRELTQTLRVSLGIYAHAAVLWRRGARFHRHPRRGATAAPVASPGRTP